MGTKSYDAIVSDYQMPGMDGIGFLKEVRSSGNTVPFILFTGRGREEVVIQALNEGANFYLQKGGDPIAQFAELSHKIQIAVEHHRSAEKIRSLNRLYSVLSETTKAVFHTRTKSGFFTEICRVLTETGGFRMAWIGLADPEHRIIRSAAFAGNVDGYLDHIDISTEDVPRGRGPTGTAYREGKFFFSNDITLDPRMEPWREEALKRGYRANAAFPFALGTKNAGVLSIYAPVTGFFDEQVIDLLAELADDISFALRTMDDQDAAQRADAALRESERRYRNVVEDQTEFISRFLPDGTHVFVNEAYCRYFGLDRDAIVGHAFRPQIPPGDRERVGRFFASLTPEHPVGSIDQRITMPDGSIRWQRWSDRAIFDPAGTLIEYQSVGRDITGQKQAEEALREAGEKIRESEEFLRTVISGAREGIVVYDRGLRITLWNRFMEDMTGLKAADVLGKYPFEIFPFLKEQGINLLMQQALTGTTTESPDFEFLIHSSGKTGWVKGIYSPNYNAHGAIVGVIGIVRDITARKRVEDALQRRTEELDDRNRLISTLLNTVPIGIFMVEVPSGKPIIANQEATRLLGRGILPDATEANLAEVYEAYRTGTSEKYPTGEMPIVQGMQGKKSHIDDMEVVRPDGTRVLLEIFGNPVTDNQGRTIASLVSFLDITGRRKAEGALRDAYEQITLSEEELRQQFDELKKSEDAVRESEQKLQGIVLGSPIPQFVIDKDHRVVSWNRALEEHSGVKAGVVLGTTQAWRAFYDTERPVLSNLLVGNDTERIRELYAGKYSTSKYVDDAWEVTDFFPHMGEHGTWLYFTAALLRDSQGRIAGAVETLEDITDRKKAEDELQASCEELTASEEELHHQLDELKRGEDALRENEEKYRSILENIQDVYYRSDSGGNLIMVSPSAAQLLGYEPSELIGKNIAQSIYYRPEDRSEFLADLAESGSVTNYEVTLKRRDGTPVTVSTSSHLYRDPSGKPRGVEGIFRDITERKKMEEALEDSRRRMSEIISFLPDATFAIDRSGTVIAWNHAMEEMTGVPAPQILGKGNYEYAVPFYGARRPILIDLVFTPAEEIAEKYTFVRINGDVLTAETTNATPLGKTVVLWGKAAPLYDREGNVTGAIESIRDITERTRAEEALVQANRKLNLLSGVTRHDINNQLTVLQSYLSILENKHRPDPANEKYFRELATAAQRISFMIRFTKDYESIGVNAPVWQDCRALVETAAAQATLGNVTVKNDIPAGTEVFADPLIVKVFYNLMDNAVRHGGKITSIRFRVQESGGDPVLICEDDGEGVAADEKEKIFERGFGKNTGLGLFLAREILEISGITLAETGVPGKGARFELKVPKGAYRVIPVISGRSKK